MSSVDLMAIAIDWLDAYRAGDLFIVDLYAEDASLRCDCGGEKELRGAGAITAYWQQRLVEEPAGELIDLQWEGSNVARLPRARWDCEGDAHVQCRRVASAQSVRSVQQLGCGPPTPGTAY